MYDSLAHDWLETRKEALRALEAARSEARATLEANPALSQAFGEHLSRMRLNATPGRSHNPKAVIRFLGSGSGEARWLLAILGPGNGVAKGVMEFLPHFGLDEERRGLAALACAEAEPEKTLEHLQGAALGSLETQLTIVLLALAQQPPLDFEEQKMLEVLYLSGEGEGAPDLRRRYEQARSRFQAHSRHHLLQFVPQAILRDPPAHLKVLQAMVQRDPYGTMEYLRGAPLPHPFEGIPQEQRLDLLDLLASSGLGFASNYLDLFELQEDPATLERLKALFVADLTAGSSIYGVYAMEGAQNYPFGLRKIEPALPRRISNAETLAYLRKDSAESVMPKAYSPAEIGNMAELLQEREVQKFLELLKADIFLEWKAQFSENKRAVVFGDLELKIRNILFLVAHATFKDNAYFDELLATIGATHPSTLGNPAHLHLLANRYFFMEILGINPGMLFNSPRGAAAPRAPIEEVKNYRVLYLLHVAMSIHLHVGDALFHKVPIAWNMLQKQGDGTLDTAMHEVLPFFDAFDTLLVLGKPVVPHLKVWLAQIVEALAQGIPEVPVAAPAACPDSSLRLVTREAVTRYREMLNGYCLQLLRQNAAQAGLSITNVIQNLRLPRTKTDKLFALLEEDRKRDGKPQ